MVSKSFNQSRRNILRGIAYSGATAMAPAATAQELAKRDFFKRWGWGGNNHTETIIIGAGAAGLYAARTLAAANRDFIVLEARDRVGGRMLNHVVTAPGAKPGTIVEIGGQWVGPTQDYVLKLIQDLGLSTFKSYDQGKYIDCRAGKVGPYSGRIPPMALRAVPALGQLEAMAAKVPADAPWKATQAAEWDSQTVQTWLNQHIPHQPSRNLVELMTELVFAASPSDISLLHFLFYVRSAGSLDALLTTGGGAQDSRIVGGSQRICLKMAEALGDRVRLNSVVRDIAQDESGVTVKGDGFEIKGSRVIVAIPPTLAGRIRYSPQLNALRDQLTQRMPMGTTIKVQCIYPRPFWRDRGLAGQVTSDTGLVRGVFDNSPPDAHIGVLMGFADANHGRSVLLLSSEERKRLIVSDFVRYFGNEAAQPLEYIEKDWSAEEFSRGCYSGYFPPGVWTSYGKALREPCGRVHWAGTETAETWNGYIDGALRSGERAAHEVLAGQQAWMPQQNLALG